MRDMVGISGPPCSGKTRLLAWLICLLSGWSDVGCLIGSFEMPRKVFLKEYLQVAFNQLQKVKPGKYKSVSELPIEFIDADDDLEDITPSDFKEILQTSFDSSKIQVQAVMLDNTQYILGSCDSDTAHIDFFNNLRRFTKKNSCSVTIINHVVKSWPDTKPITKQALEKGRTLQQVADLMIFTQRWFVNVNEDWYFTGSSHVFDRYFTGVSRVIH